MKKSFEKLCYEFSTESSKEFKRIRSLLCDVPRREFIKLTPTICHNIMVSLSTLHSFYKRSTQPLKCVKISNKAIDIEHLRICDLVGKVLN